MVTHYRSPVFGEVDPHLLHEVADVAVDDRPLELLRHDASDVAQCFVVERVTEQVVQIPTMRHTCRRNECRLNKSHRNAHENMHL